MMGIADSKFLATRTIRSLLLANADLVALIGDKIFPIAAPTNTDGDFILYKRDKYSKERTKMGICAEKCEVYLTAVSEDYDRSVDEIVLINNILEGKHNGLNIELLDANEDFIKESESDVGKYVQEILFSIE